MNQSKYDDFDPNVMDDDEDDEELKQNQFLTFEIDNEIYAVDILSVVEIIRLTTITSIPEPLPYVKGVINLRGKIIPIVDMRKRFGIADIEYDERTCIVVAKINNTDIGMIVDSVSEVVEINHSDIEGVPDINRGAHKNYVQGIGKINNEVKIIVDLTRLFEDDLDNMRS